MKRIFLVGFMGAGKTTLGNFMQDNYDFSFIDLDHYIERRFFKTINALFDTYGEEGFRQLEKEMLHEVADIENVIIATGGGTPCFFDNMDYMITKGTTVFLDVPRNELLNRLEQAKSKRPLLKDKNKEEIALFIEQSMQKRRPFYEKATLTIDTTSMYTKEDITAIAEKVLDFTRNTPHK